MKNSSKLNKLLFLISGVLFFIVAFIGKNYVFIPIGSCFVVLGCTRWEKSNDKNKNDK